MSIGPASGFFFQSRAGSRGNFEVVVPWPEGGLALYWRDNDDVPALPWRGPFRFGGSDRYLNVSLCESDFRSFDGRAGNLELLALRENGDVVHFWRENYGARTWFGPSPPVTTGCIANPALVATGGRLSVDERRSLYSITVDRRLTDRLSGFQYRERWYQEPYQWEVTSAGVLSDAQGLAMLVSTVPEESPAYSHRNPGWTVLVAVAEGGHLVLGGLGQSLGDGAPVEVTPKLWRTLTFGIASQLPTLGPLFRGRPAIIQSSYDLVDPGWLSFDDPHHGNYELIVPMASGGIRHLWKDNGTTTATSNHTIANGWTDAGVVFGQQAVYDEVSMIQSNFSSDDHQGNLEVVARRNGQAGFDFFWREQDMVWRGPISIA